MRVVDVPAGAAGSWIKEAFALFRAQPVGWISLTSTWLLFSVAVFFLLPMVGPALVTMLQPGLFAGFVLAARDQQSGGKVAVAHLFAGFRVNGRALLTVGSITLLAEIVILLLLSALGFPRTIPVEGDGMPDMAAYLRLLDGKEWMIFLGFALMLVIKAILWFTAPLLALHQMPASHAIRWSFYAFIANFLPLALFGIAMLALFVFAAMPWLLGMMAWIPLYALAHFTSYRQVFRED